MTTVSINTASSMSTPIRVAVTQVEPVYLDLAASVEKAVALVREAAEHGAKLIAFPECWLPGYPAWIWARPVDFDLQTRYIYNSLSLSSEAMDLLKATAKECSIAIVLGFSEQSRTHSIYISQAILSPQGEVLMHRRKIKPTHMERTLFGDGSDAELVLNNVVEIDFGPDYGKIKEGLSCRQPGGGHSCVIGPDGRRLTNPLEGSPGKEGIVYADLDLTKVVATRGFLDIVGHYSRPDLLWLGVDRQHKGNVITKRHVPEEQENLED
ncbi:hypothetical protein FSOLCH5_013591 [Fusarium solani]